MDEGHLLDLADERSQDVPLLKKWLKQGDKWLNSAMQYECIEIMATAFSRALQNTSEASIL
ncbi:hypothetical protein HPB48_012915 [Haemaphysalis longicornis]|uniref:Uncharacterized protein n=1 Tax=Haemaphysalis longicornis TaxID=44386 RepID=A0A9J6GLL4_HAELO|nr:hypothetical protein HPB48_012915 [Haemaphysalis longicornis]